MAPHQLEVPTSPTFSGERPMSPLSLTRSLSRPMSLSRSKSQSSNVLTKVVSKRAPLSEAFGEPLSEQTHTLGEGWAECVKKYPDNFALACIHQPADLYDYQKVSKTPYLKWTYKELDKAATALAMNLTASCGMNKGMPLATLLYNGVESQIATIAAFKAGLPLVPINPRNLMNVEEIEHMLKVSGSKGIIVADGELSTKMAKDLPDLVKSMTFTGVVDTNKSSESWTPFSVLVEPTILQCPALHLSNIGIDDPAIIFFTSGSTSRPKACPHTSRTFGSNIRALFLQYPEIDSTVVGLLASPNNHVIFPACALTYWAVGGEIVLPGFSYSPKELLKATELEKCTDVAFIPTMAHQVIREMRDGGKEKPPSWKRASLGGAPVSGSIMKSVQKDLGFESIGTAFGMTEGFITNAGYSKDVDKITRFNGSRASCGYVIPGAKLRVCYPGTNQPVPRGEFGEVHYGGPQMFLGYVGKDRKEDWYSDEDGDWLNSGDQGVMENDGSLVITGRYKDILIRGGENVSPALIESVLGSVDGIEAVVIGVPDEFAGEVPVAIIKATVPYSTEKLGEKVSTECGSNFVPEVFLDIKDLGMEAFPTTTTSKVKKPELTVIVREYLAKQEAAENSAAAAGHTSEVVNQLWTKLVGHKVDPDTPVTFFADSIAIVRFLDGVHKKLGKNLTVDDITNNPTINKQIYLIDGMSASPVAKNNGRVISQAKRKGPPTGDDMVHVMGRQDIANDTINAVEKIIKPLGLTFDDVQDVAPAYDQAAINFKKRRFHSWAVRLYLAPKEGLKFQVQELRKVLEAALDHSPMIASFLIRLHEGTRKELPLFVTMHSSENWFDKLISTGHEVETQEEFCKFGLENPDFDNAELPGPLFRAQIIWIKERQTAGIAMTTSHSTFDGMNLMLFLEDLQAAVNGEPLQDHDDYKVWSDNYFLLRTSYTASVEASWHVDRLQGLETHRAGLFPPQRAPEWFHGGSNEGWSPSPSDGKSFSNPERKNLNSTIRTDEGPTEGMSSMHLPDLRKLQGFVSGLTGPVILKAAIALFNTQHTGHSHALFSSLEAGRSSLPFVTGEIRDRLAIDCSNVPGPMYQRVIDLIGIHKDETVAALLTRLQKLQKTMTKYSSAPAIEIMRQLGPEAGAIYEDVGRRQILNWAPGIGTAASTGEDLLDGSIHLLRGRARTDEGFIWMAGMGGDDGLNVYLKAIFDDANFETAEANGWVKEVLDIAAWIVKEENWRKEVGGFVEAVGGAPVENGTF